MVAVSSPGSLTHRISALKWLSPGQTKECGAASWLAAPPAHPCCCRHLSKRGERCGWRDAGLGQLQGCMPEGRIRLPRPEWLRAGCWEQYFRPHRCTDIISALFGTTFMIRVLLQGLRCKEWDLQITSGRGSLLESCSFCLFWLTDSAFRGHLGWIDMFSFSVCAAVQGSCRLQ